MESANEKESTVRVWDSLASELLSAYNNEAGTYTNMILCRHSFSKNNSIQLTVCSSKKLLVADALYFPQKIVPFTKLWFHINSNIEFLI